MPKEIREIMKSDSRTAISFYLVQPAATVAGVLGAVDLTLAVAGDVKFEMFNAADGVETIAATATGVTFAADATGLVHYEFATPMVIAVGIYYGYYLFTEGGKTDHFPKDTGMLEIRISDHTQTALEAYYAAVEAAAVLTC